MRFVLLSLNVIIMVSLGVYLLNLFSINELGLKGIGLIIVSSLAIVLFSEYMIKEYNINNPLFFILPGLASALISVFATKGVSIVTIIGTLFIVPGLVMIIQKNAKENK